MFNVDNFRYIFDTENRKGRDLANRFFPAINSQTFAVKQEMAKLRDLRKQRTLIPPHDFEEQKIALQTRVRHLKTNKSLAIDFELEALSQRVACHDFTITVEQKVGPGGKLIYCVDNSPEAFFVEKQIQRNINKIYGVKQSNRHDLLCQLRETLSSRFPFEVVRTDIKSFYESIDREKLLRKLDEDQLLSYTSKKFVNQIIESYEKQSQSGRGIPRGVGISSYLAELYLRQIDREIRAIEGLVLYCRYVDDIVAIFARPPHHSRSIKYKDLIVKILSDYDLEHNESKTHEIDIATQNSFSFDYLGYQFSSNNTNGNCPKILPNSAKINKAKIRLKLSFLDYMRNRCHSPRSAFRLLVARVKFLTGNTRLSNSKSNANTGIFYNNDLVNDDGAFDELDRELKKLLGETRHPQLKKRLKNCKFGTGFRERRFHNFNFKQLQNIVEVWRYA